MQLAQRIALLTQLGEYINTNNTNWQQAKTTATAKNGWFTPAFIELATNAITQFFLQKKIVEEFANHYELSQIGNPKQVGIVMAGNIPLVGFHDFLCVFLSGHKMVIKLSEKDDVLLPHLINKLIEWNSDLKEYVTFASMLKNADAYIATGSNNTARYFEQYFGKYPNIIRKNRTSVALLDGTETVEELTLLADDVYLYFGLGCRNVTKIFVPNGYDFVPLLNAFNKYNHFKDHNKYRNNYDYNLAIHILNKVYYMTNESILLIEDERNFSPISQLHYSYYTAANEVVSRLTSDDTVQCIVGKHYLPFGSAQQPTITQFADGVDTMDFCIKIG